MHWNTLAWAHWKLEIFSITENQNKHIPQLNPGQKMQFILKEPYRQKEDSSHLITDHFN